MRIEITSEESLKDFLNQARLQSWPQRSELSWRVGKDMAMYLGHQWLVDTSINEQNRMTGTTALPQRWDPDGQKLRASLNRISKHVHNIAATTRPDDVEVEAHPPEFRTGLESMDRAKVLENTANVMSGVSGYVRHRRRANYLRTICGSAGVGLYMQTGKRTVAMSGQNIEVPDAVFKAFSFLPHQLILDPGNTSNDLDDHEYVIYEEVMTKPKLERVFQRKFEDKELRPFGELTMFEQFLSALTGGRVYAQFRMNSRVPAGRVLHVYMKDQSGRFGKYFLAVENTVNQFVLTTFGQNNNESPWGGNGCPLRLFHAHLDPDSPFGISDVAQMTADQKWLNLYVTYLLRAMRNHAGWKWMIDKRSIADGNDREKARADLTNEIGGVYFYDKGRKEADIPEPRIQAYPAPPSFVIEGLQAAEGSMREMAHRSEGSYGITKSHVPDATFQAAQIEGDKVLSARVHDDIEQDLGMVGVIVGTTIKLVKSHAPETLATLRIRGFGPEQFTALLGEDECRPSADFTIRESSIRHRPHLAKKNDLLEALKAQAITGKQFREAAASEFLDIPITALDRAMSSAASTAAQEVAAGIGWAALPLGEYSDFFISAFRQMILDDRVKHDPEAQQRLAAAITSQMQQAMEDQINSDPNLYMQRQQAQQQQAAEQQKQEEEAQEQAQQQAEEQAEQEQEAAKNAQPSTLAQIIDHFIKPGGQAPAPDTQPQAVPA